MAAADRRIASRCGSTTPARVGFWGIQFAKTIPHAIFYAVKGPGHVAGSCSRIPLLGGTPRPVLAGHRQHDQLVARRPAFTYLRERLSGSRRERGDDRGCQRRQSARRSRQSERRCSLRQASSWPRRGRRTARRIAAPVRDSAARSARLVTIDVATGAEQRCSTRDSPRLATTSWLPDGTGIAFVGTPPGVYRHRAEARSSSSRSHRVSRGA